MRPLARWNPARGVWETENVALCGHSEPYSETWPSSGMTRSGTAFELPTPAHRTDASASSSSPGLPTPRASRGASGTETMYALGGERDDSGRPQGEVLLKTPTSQLAVNGGSQHPDKRRAGGHGPTLADEVEHLLPTPRATDGTKGGPNQRGSSGDLMLPSAVTHLLPTPAVNDMGAAYTPETWDEWTAKMQAAHGNGNGHGKSLAIEAQRLLPTPTASDWKRDDDPADRARNSPGITTVSVHFPSSGVTTSPPSDAGKP